LLKALPEIRLLKKSAPPITEIKPNKTTMCIKSFCCEGRSFVKKDKINTGSPTKVGIKDVIELLLDTCVTIIPQVTKIAPKIIELSMALKPINRNSLDMSSVIHYSPCNIV
tara:strand:- start:1630 stop:1962 length:333 start_codon:yes stop_codon:yes gene_type:complete